MLSPGRFDYEWIYAYASTTDPDSMNWHEAMKEPDNDQFLKAMQQEVESHCQNDVWEMIHKKEVPERIKVLPSVWAMKRKRRIATREVYKWKARLNIDGSKQQYGLNYWETYSPVASWKTIRLLLVFTLIYGWKTKQIDFVLAYTQAVVECDLYMEIPKGFEVVGENLDYVLKLKKNLFGQKQAGRVWNKHLVKKLESVGFKQSVIDECLFYKGSSMFILYTDDSTLVGPNDNELEVIIKDMQKADLNMTIEGDISDFLGVQIERKTEAEFYLTQPHLINDILKELRLDQASMIKKTPGMSSKVLLRHSKSKDFDQHFDYRKSHWKDELS
jgi:Reverse transcriptase (RNA-dependent DNA polymerase)